MSFAERLREIFATPTWPLSLERAPQRTNVGLDYDTAWARTRPARLARALIADNVARPLARVVANPRVYGTERLEAITGPAIFVANHSSHLDTAVVLGALPARFRHHCVVDAAADYFFDRTWKAALWSLLLGAIPVERTRVNRRSHDLAAGLIAEGWSLVIFPEGGRTTDGWGQEFHPASAAYLAKRCAVPVVPIHLRGMRPLLPKGHGVLSPGTVEVRIGAALRPLERASGRDEHARRFSERIEAAVALLADEAESDWWQARRRGADGAAAAFRGPQAAAWRRSWALPESARARRVRAGSRARPW